jgi:hypothetical protein
MIKHEKGIVTYVMRTGGTFVRSTMPLATAKGIMRRSKNVEETDKRGFGTEICVDDKYFFPIVPAKKQDEEKADEVTE